MEGITREFEILKHLGSKVTKKNAEFKLSEEQRSIEELEHYIVTSFPAQISLMVEGIRNLDSHKERNQNCKRKSSKRRSRIVGKKRNERKLPYRLCIHFFGSIQNAIILAA